MSDKRVLLNRREDLPLEEPVVFCTWIEGSVEYGKWFLASELQKVETGEMN